MTPSATCLRSRPCAVCLEAHNPSEDTVISTRNHLHLAAALAVIALLGSSNPARAARLLIHAATVTDTSEWNYPARAAGDATGDCTNAIYFAYNDVMASTQYMEVTQWENFQIPVGEAIQQVFVDVDGRYDTPSTNNRFGLRVRGSVATTTRISPTWSQSDESCVWRFGGDGWDITGLLGRCWTAADINAIRLAVRRYQNNDTIGISRARVKCFRLVVLTGVVSVAEVPIDAGEVEVGQSETSEFDIDNEGDGTVSVNVGLSCGSPFSIVSGGGAHQILPGESHTVEIGFAPTVVGSFSCDVSTGFCGLTIPVVGSSYCDPSLEISEDIDFGDVDVGQMSQSSVVLTNTGPCPLPLSIAMDGSCAGFSILSGGGNFTLAPNQTREVVFAFAPLSHGDYECTIPTGVDDAVVALAGTGVCEETCTVMPAELDFDEVLVGSTGVKQFAISNPGPCELRGNVALESPCGDFAITAGIGDYVLAPGQSRTVTVVFTPTGDEGSSCTITTGCEDVDVIGFGSFPDSECYVPEAYLDFESSRVGSIEAKSFTLFNLGNISLSGNVSMDCATPPFSFVSGGGPYSLAPGDSLSVVLQFVPVSAGDFECEISTGCPDNEVLVLGSCDYVAAVQEELDHSRFVIQPNPAPGAVLFEFYARPESGVSVVDIFDLSGRLLKRLTSDAAGGGYVHLRWDGRDQLGTRLPSGVYLARRYGPDASVHRIMLIH